MSDNVKKAQEIVHKSTSVIDSSHTIFLEELVSCSRCGKDHDNITFKRFKFATDHSFTHWASCPNNGDPILLKIARS